MTKFLSTKAKRKVMAKFVSDTATEIMGIPVILEPCAHYPDEFQFRMENFETDNGEVHHCVIDVCPRGVNVHIKFPRAFGHKWNHYIWPYAETTDPFFYERQVESELWRILSKTIPNGATRQDRPSMFDYWEHERALFAAGKFSKIYSVEVAA